jgi:hypothetical protein
MGLTAEDLSYFEDFIQVDIQNIEMDLGICRPSPLTETTRDALYLRVGELKGLATRIRRSLDDLSYRVKPPDKG